MNSNVLKNVDHGSSHLQLLGIELRITDVSGIKARVVLNLGSQHLGLEHQALDLCLVQLNETVQVEIHFILLSLAADK